MPLRFSNAKTTNLDMREIKRCSKYTGIASILKLIAVITQTGTLEGIEK
jgi:hypothetical protein